MKLYSKLIGLSLGTMVVFTGLTTTLVVELKSVATGYNDLLRGPVTEAEEARVTQVDFKKQVQEWKDILLRGHNADDLAKYTGQFHAQEAKVKSEAKALAAKVSDPDAKKLLNDFLNADDVLSGKYQAAYDIYVEKQFDFKAADKMVRGQDRPPTDLFDKVVATLNQRALTQIALQQAQAQQQRNTVLAIAIALIAMICVVGAVVVRSFMTRLGLLKQVSDKLANADVEGLNIDISGSDEVGELGQSLTGVSAAIEELLAVAAE